MKNFQSKKFGFTLIELLVIIAITTITSYSAGASENSLFVVGSQ